MSAIRTARDRARAEVTAELKAEARRQLATVGAAGLSLRAVARALGMAPSAPYRYFTSRDALLTALIMDAYDALGARVEAADAEVERAEHRARWRAFCASVRAWATTTPYEYALVYGSPVPGYEAPRDTVASAARVPFGALRIVADAYAAAVLRPVEVAPAPSAPLEEQAAEVARLAEVDLPESLVVAATLAWAQLFGALSFELFGHLAGSFEPADELFGYAVEQMADLMGLP